MMTTYHCLVIITIWASTTLALDTLYVGDYIAEPTYIFTGLYSANSQQYGMSDGYISQNAFIHAIGPNGNGLMVKFVDQTLKTSVCTLVLKNKDGTYRTIDLPFNATISRTTATNGQIYLCGTKIFWVGTDDSIRDVQELYSPNSGTFPNYGIFASNNIFLDISTSYHRIWTNSSGVWEKVSEDYIGTYGSIPRQTNNYIAVPTWFNDVSSYGYYLYQRADEDLSWTQVDRVLTNTTVVGTDTGFAVWDGTDTLFVGYRIVELGFNTVRGQVQIWRKSNAQWRLQKNITSEELGLAAPGGLGIGLYLLDNKTLIVHSAEGYNRTRYMRGGAAFAVEKIANDWVVTKKFVQQDNDRAYLVGPMNYDPSDGRLYFSACSLHIENEGPRFSRRCGIKYATWQR